MGSQKVLVCDRFSQESLAFLSSNIDCEVLKSKGRTPTYEEVEIIDVALIRSRSVFDKKLLSCAKNLKLIVTATSGFDHIDLKECKNKSIAVMHTPNANVESASQLTLLLLLSLYRNLLGAHSAVLSHMWKEELSQGFEVTGKNLGIIGFGRVGQRVGQLFQALGAHVSAYDPYLDEKQFQKNNVTPLGLTELLRDSDIVSLHAPWSRETSEMINKKTLEVMSENSVLINASRGSLVNENDLVEALVNKTIAGAALDVFTKEPLPRDSNLRTLDNLVLTPHIGAYTSESFAKASMEAVKKVCAYFNNNEVSDELPPNLEWFEKYGQ